MSAGGHGLAAETNLAPDIMQEHSWATWGRKSTVSDLSQSWPPASWLLVGRQETRDIWWLDFGNLICQTQGSGLATASSSVPFYDYGFGPHDTTVPVSQLLFQRFTIPRLEGDETQHLYAVSPTNLWCLRRHLRIAPLAILSQSKV